MRKIEEFEAWFIVGSQDLYGQQTINKVATHAKEVAAYLNNSQEIPVQVLFKTVVKSSQEIAEIMLEANANPNCVGLIAWMHTFSPGKMWIKGLNLLSKPMLHFHTQYNREIPWESIDMDFMNENQSAHGDREFGFINARLRKQRKVITGHWQDRDTLIKIGTWTRAASGWHVLQSLKIARFGDNMRNVAVTEGDKVEAQSKWGAEVNGYGIGDLTQTIDSVKKSDADELLEIYFEEYEMRDFKAMKSSLSQAAKIELGLTSFLRQGGFEAFTDTFENLHGLDHLPGIAVQRPMQKGFGFGAEGDWKTAGLLRAAKVMESGLRGGTSFMEDYTYHFGPDQTLVLGSHMLEICPSIAKGRPSCEVHPLSIGGKADPPRLVFNVGAGPGINVSIMDMGNRFRLLVNEIAVVEPGKLLPELPVARAFWIPQPNMEKSATAWIYAGGSHHTVFSKSLNKDVFMDFAEISGMECLLIDKNTDLHQFRETLKVNEVYYHLFEKGY